MFGMGGVRLDLFSEFDNMVVYGAGSGIGIISPDSLDEFIPMYGLV